MHIVRKWNRNVIYKNENVYICYMHEVYLNA